ncbi:MAG: hypothetical protein ABUS54_01925 [Actinomycetota bacterium]
MRRLTLALAGLCVCLCAGAINSHAATRATSGQEAALTWLSGQIRGYEQATWHWQRVMGIRTSRTTGQSVRQLGVPGAKAALHRWRRLAARARRLAQHPPHYSDFMCIHRFEGSWTDSGSPYWGGLQMNLSFQATYGAWLYRTKGTADHWTPLEQIWVAEKALKSRGFYPWPLTARDCGLI